jgi:hypothetical protein
MVGGPGMGRGRRDPKALRIGDHIDSWKVIGMEPGQRLTLEFGMRAPGAGILEFLIEPAGDNRTKVTATAYWHPAGMLGLAYWYSLEPAHKVIFKGLTREICRRAEAEASQSRQSAGQAADGNVQDKPDKERQAVGD